MAPLTDFCKGVCDTSITVIIVIDIFELLDFPLSLTAKILHFVTIILEIVFIIVLLAIMICSMIVILVRHD